MGRSYLLISDNWSLLKSELFKEFVSFEDVSEFLKLASGKEDLELKGLLLLPEAQILTTFNFIRLKALEIEQLFPSLKVPILEPNENISYELSREQILVLMCHMTLLTLKPTSRHCYWVTFENWLCDGRPCATAYLQALFNYFSEAAKQIESSWRTEVITFERRTNSSSIFPLSDYPLPALDLHLSGGIGDHSRFIIDFANQHIGFGIGGTQEEVIFGSFLEMCPAMLFCCEAMKDDEAIIVKNILKYASFTGYGFDLKFDKEATESLPSNAFSVIAIDALDFSADYDRALKLQLEPRNLERELKKLIAGFSAFKDCLIDTGNWGCGAFGGNKCIKACLQLIAAGVTGNRLSFCCFGDELFFAFLTAFWLKIRQSQITTRQLWDALLRIDSELDEVSFEVILNLLSVIK